MVNQGAKEAGHNTAIKHHRQVDQERLEKANQRADLIRCKNHFKCIKMHYLSHFASHVRRFGSISIYSTEIGGLVYKEQIKDRYRRSNKNEAARKILSQYGRQHALGMRLQTIEAHLKIGVIVVGNSGMEMPTSSSRCAPCRMLKGCMNIGTLSELCRAHEIEYCDRMEEILRFIKQTVADDPRLSADPTELGLLPVECFNQLEILVSDFQEADVSISTGPAGLEQRLYATAVLETIGYGSTLAGGELWGFVRKGTGSGTIISTFQDKNVLGEAAGVHRLALVRVHSLINGGGFHLASGHI